MRLEVTSDKARHMQHLTRSSKALGDVFAGLGNYLIFVSQKGKPRGMFTLFIDGDHG